MVWQEDRHTGTVRERAKRTGRRGEARVDAPPDDEYTGEDGGMGGMANPGHIPGAQQMYWEELIGGRDGR